MDSECESAPNLLPSFSYTLRGLLLFLWSVLRSISLLFPLPIPYSVGTMLSYIWGIGVLPRS